ncbi:MAG: mandelate racemase/muconate lactonizing enzyme family protein [Steroidobacteraceae bacterium]
MRGRRAFCGGLVAAAVGVTLASHDAFGAAAPPAATDRIRRIRVAEIGAGVVVVVDTESGLSGHGFTAITNSPVVVSVVRDVIAKEITGEDALAREAIYDRLQRLLVLRGLMAGHAMHAISAIDIALWDIAGKRAGLPVWRLLGGARPVIPAYTTFGMANMDRTQLVAAAREHVAGGQTRLKMVVAANSHERAQRGEPMEDILREDVERIRLVREAVGPDVSLFIDANHGLNEYEARRFIERIEPYGLALFEEPLRGNDVRRLADLRKHSPIPLSAGQNEGNIARWRDFAVNDAVDILQLNVCMCGGYTGAMKIAGLAAAFAMPIDNGGGYALFNMHLHGGVANGGMVEWHMNSVSLEREFYRERFELHEGRLTLPERPGLGFELKPETLRKLG